MNPQQHNRAIRKYAAARGIDPLAALRAAPAARRLRETLAEEDLVIWSPDAGGAAWEVLTAGQSDDGGNGFPGRILAVLPEGGAASPSAWRDLGKLLSGRQVVLETLLLNGADVPGDEPASRRENPAVPDTPEPLDAPAGKGGPVTRLLRRLLEKMESRETGEVPEEGTSPDIPVELNADLSDTPKIPERPQPPETPEIPGFSLLAAGDIPPAERLAPAMAFPGTSCPGIHTPSPRVPLGERFHLARCAAAAGFYPLIPLRPGESSRAAVLAETFFPIERAFSLLCSPDEPVVPGQFRELEVLSPASASDLSGAVDWAVNEKRRALIVDPGERAHPERNVLKKTWEEGAGVTIRESGKGSAGKVLIVVPGGESLSAAKTADRLIRDNISVTLLGMRFPCRSDSGIPAVLLQGVDLVAAAGDSPVADIMKSGIVRFGLEKGTGDILIQDPDVDSALFAEKISARLREMRIRRTVDDVKADRW